MRTNRSWLVRILAGGIVLSIAGESHAQSFSFSSVNWLASGLNNSFVGSGPAVNLSGTNTLTTTTPLTFAAPGSTLALAFPAVVHLQILDFGNSGNSTLTQPSTVTFASAAGSATPTFSQLFTATENAGHTGGFYSIAASPTIGFTIFDGTNYNGFTANFVNKPFTSYTFGAPSPAGEFNTSPDLSFTMNVTYQGIVPEPATLALFGLGLAPIAVAIRRRRK